MTGIEREALRQRMMLRALLGDARPGVVAGWMRDGARFERGLQAYRANAGALAERALAAAFPTLLQLLGEESFAALARAFWRRQPPSCGDIAEWGGALPAFIEADAQLADEPYLGDVARLEWAVHQAERAADGAAAPEGLALMAEQDPAELFLRLQPGTAVLGSAHPIVTIWQAHRSDAPDRFAAVREAFAAGWGEAAWVGRRDWKVEVRRLDEAGARFTAALLAGRPLGAALALAGERFEFEPWLIDALQRQAIAAITQELS
jgi:hypothetical protein